MSLDMTFWDVQHGDAAFISTPNQTYIAHDLGKGSYEDQNESFSPLKHLKRRYIDQLDTVIITHPHKDHIEDILQFDILNPRTLAYPRHLTRSAILSDVRPQDSALFEKYFKICDQYTYDAFSNSPLDPANNGGVKIQVFSPNEKSQSNLNNHSLVTVLSYAESKIILPGDNESPSWNELLGMPEFRSAIQGADMLLAPHHGRKDGFHPDLFDFFTPKLTIISDGRFGDTSATDRYSSVSSGWKVHHRNGGSERRNTVTTRQDGVIVVKFGHGEDRPYIYVEVN